MKGSKVMISSGSLPSPRIDRLAACRPFIQQIDVVFPSSALLYEALSSLETTYFRGQFTLSELYEYACHVPTQNVLVSFKALPLNSDGEDAWCVDPRGILTLCVSKAVYERLGLVGNKLPFKGRSDQYSIQIPLRKEMESVAVRARQKAALNAWDSLRDDEGLGKWDVAYKTGPSGGNSHQVVEVKAHIRHEENVHIPVINTAQPAGESLEDRQERLSDLFEWVGMACLGAQRLKANDRIDPYVAVYEPPMSSRVANITHLRWRGLMDSTFIQSMITTASSLIADRSLIASTTSQPDNSFISITTHSNLMAPVSYTPTSSSAPGASEAQAKNTPLRVPSPEADDTSCLILASASEGSTWVNAQCVGMFDTRWG
ncbi:hypothetical protein HYDPIDRAFT_130784 [Hydnomerulius pinastri MD-312]|nr:hypothetical protein HYDPIDRAFT_130784 [Hydnomerulius pinastri MD-312]